MEYQIIAIAGKAGSGKGTFADMLIRNYDFQPMAFADPMKVFIHQVLQIPTKNLWGSSEFRTPYCRDVLQSLGTWGRNFRPAIWAEYLIRRLHIWQSGQPDPLGLLPLNAPRFRVVITDLRFPNELECLRTNIHTDSILITRPHMESHLTEGQQAHESEVSLDRMNEKTFDYVLKNDSDLPHFKGICTQWADNNIR